MMDTGVVFDEVHGYHNMYRVIGLAQHYGFVLDDYIDSEIEHLHECTDAATEFLNSKVAEPGYTFDWHEGNFCYHSVDDWKKITSV